LRQFEVQFSPRALEQVTNLHSWWRENRPAAPDLFSDELADAVTELEVHPRVGSPYRLHGPSQRRRLLLQRTRYHVYYVIDEGERVVTIQAVWHCSRGAQPRLR
jgi:plasmid stabilization system protein ParE